MKNSITILCAAIGLVAAIPSRHHQHHRHHQRDSAVATTGTTVAEYVAGPTVVMYSLNGNIISEDEVMEGIKNGTLVWANGAPSFAETSSAAPSTSSVAVPTTSSTTLMTSTSAPPPPPSSTSTSTTSTQEASTTSSQAAASSSASSSSSSGSSGTGLDQTFPDGEIDCGTFPSEYGALPLNYLGLGGWTGIQSPASTSLLGFLNIKTVTHNLCQGKDCCTDGQYCSYACPPGYQKSQWPSTQGSTGQSVGGLECRGGKLYKSNPAFDTLCVTGSQEVTVLVRNEMSDQAAVCRTDYPGTESETVPVLASAGGVANLTCPDSSYYQWTGKTTSAQYYVNPKGISVEDGCTWGNSDNPWGNFAPLNLGVGYSNGAAWLAIFQNAPTTTANLDFTITLEGDNMNGYCRYQNGQYCSGKNYDNCGSSGCTVSASSGTVYFVFSD